MSTILVYGRLLHWNFSSKIILHLCFEANMRLTCFEANMRLALQWTLFGTTKGDRPLRRGSCLEPLQVQGGCSVGERAQRESPYDIVVRSPPIESILVSFEPYLNSCESNQVGYAVRFLAFCYAITSGAHKLLNG